MMAIMTDGNKEVLPKEFVEGGRTGRRNAMPDILHSDANVTTADLPTRLEQLATSGVQSASSPTSISNCSSCGTRNSNILLKKFLASEHSGRRNAIYKTPNLYSKDEATAVTSTVFPASVSEEMLEGFLKSGCCKRRVAIPCIDPTNLPRQHSVGTAVSDESWKYCCSEECLQEFLRSELSKRRVAVPHVCIPRPAVGTSVNSSDLRIALQRAEHTEYEYDNVPHFEIEKSGIEVIQLDERKLMEMLADLNNPQPGPSSAGSPQSGTENKDAEQKGS